MPLRKSSTPAYHLALAIRQLSAALTKLRAAEGGSTRYFELVRYRTSLVAFNRLLQEGKSHGTARQ